MNQNQKTVFEQNQDAKTYGALHNSMIEKHRAKKAQKAALNNERLQKLEAQRNMVNYNR